MRALRSAAVVIALATGCTDSCTCGEGGQDAKGAQGPTAGSQPTGQAAAKGSGAGAGATEATAPRLNPSWQPAPDSELTRQLATAKTTLETEQVFEKLATEKVLAKPLGDRLGALQAEGALSSTVREGSDDAKLSVAARNYKEGGRTVRIKISDTGLLPNARKVVSNRLTLIGNAAVGNERGVFVRGYPAVTAHYEDQKVSRASVVLAGRYLVQVMVRNTTEPDDALRVIEQLDWTGFAPKQGKIPSPAKPAQ